MLVVEISWYGNKPNFFTNVFQNTFNKYFSQIVVVNKKYYLIGNTYVNK